MVAERRTEAAATPIGCEPGGARSVLPYSADASCSRGDGAGAENGAGAEFGDEVRERGAFSASGACAAEEEEGSEDAKLRSTATEGSQGDTRSDQSDRRYQYRSRDQYQQQEQQQQNQSQYQYYYPRQHYPRPITFFTRVRFRNRAHRVAFVKSLVWEMIAWITVFYFVYAWCRNYERYFSGEAVRRVENHFGNGNGNQNERGNENGDGNEEAQLRLAGSREGIARRRRGRSKGNKRAGNRRGAFRAIKAVLRRCCLAIAAASRGFWARMREVCRVYGNGNNHRMDTEIYYTPRTTVQRFFPVPMPIEAEALLPIRGLGIEAERIPGLGLEIEIEEGYFQAEDGREGSEEVLFPQFGVATTLRRRKAPSMTDHDDDEEVAAPVSGLESAAPLPGRLQGLYAGWMMEAIIEEPVLL